ncbi:MAG: CD225/dispanin family protein [Oscillospiraceae bacterium]|nr:CD225/dispanin family protein [Oscillospiraceae bacterium]
MWSIIVSVACCLPLGIVSIVYASKINSAMAVGNYQLAQGAAKKSKLFSIIGGCVGAVFAILYFTLSVLAAIGTQY